MCILCLATTLHGIVTWPHLTWSWYSDGAFLRERETVTWLHPLDGTGLTRGISRAQSWAVTLRSFCWAEKVSELMTWNGGRQNSTCNKTFSLMMYGVAEIPSPLPGYGVDRIQIQRVSSARSSVIIPRPVDIKDQCGQNVVIELRTVHSMWVKCPSPRYNLQLTTWPHQWPHQSGL